MLQRDFENAQAEAKHAQQLVHESVQDTQVINLKDLHDNVKAETSTAHKRALSMILSRALPILFAANRLQTREDSEAPRPTSDHL